MNSRKSLWLQVPALGWITNGRTAMATSAFSSKITENSRESIPVKSFDLSFPFPMFQHKYNFVNLQMFRAATNYIHL